LQRKPAIRRSGVIESAPSQAHRRASRGETIMIRRTALVAAALAVASTSAFSQSAERVAPSFRSVDSNLHTGQLGPRGAQGGEIQVSVNFSVPFQTEERDPMKIIAAQAQFRKTLYELAQRECVGLVETIADECRMVSVNVNSNVQMQMMMTTMINANAQYRVVLKAKQ
jgi:hypothetical protein